MGDCGPLEGTPCIKGSTSLSGSSLDFESLPGKNVSNSSSKGSGKSSGVGGSGKVSLVLFFAKCSHQLNFRRFTFSELRVIEFLVYDLAKLRFTRHS